MNRLPGYDYKHNRAEKVAFAILQMMGFALVILTVANGAQFCVRRDQICQALSSNLLAAAESATNSAAKEAPRLQTKAGQQTAGAPHLTAPKS